MTPRAALLYLSAVCLALAAICAGALWRMWPMKMPRYEVRFGSDIAPQWILAKKAAHMKRGWLHYELRDGTIGLAKPGTWRVKESK